MINFGLLITTGLILTTVIFTNASTLFTVSRNIELNNTKAVPVLSLPI